MKYPVDSESLARFYKVRVNLSDRIVREYCEKHPPKPPQVIRDMKMLQSNDLIPLVVIERSNAADRALEALKHGSKEIASKAKRTNQKPTKPTKAKPANVKKSLQKKQKRSRPLFVLPKRKKH